MTKWSLLKTVSDKTGVKQGDLDKVFKALAETIVDGCASGERVKLPGVGTFIVVHRAPRAMNLPKGNGKTQIPDRFLLKFYSNGATYTKVDELSRKRASAQS